YNEDGFAHGERHGPKAQASILRGKNRRRPPRPRRKGGSRGAYAAGAGVGETALQAGADPRPQGPPSEDVPEPCPTAPATGIRPRRGQRTRERRAIGGQ